MRTPFIVSIVALGLLALAAPAAASIVPFTSDACGGTAPATTSCTSGTWTYVGVIGQVSCGVGFDYVGTVISKLVYPGGEYGVTCSKASASAQTTSTFFSSGDQLRIGETYSHLCSSNAHLTTTLGGSGQWTCGHQH